MELKRESMEFSRQEYWNRQPFLLQGIFLIQGSNLGLLHCRQILYHLSYEGVQESNGYSEPLEQASFFDLTCSGIVLVLQEQRKPVDAMPNMFGYLGLLLIKNYI